MNPYLQLIGGEWVEASNGATWDLVDPGTGEVVDHVPYGDANDASAAIDAASNAFDEWASLGPYRRAEILSAAAAMIRTNADEYARVTTEESGKPIAQSKAEWLSAPNYLINAGEEAVRLGGRIIPSRTPGRRIDVTYRPIGVVGIITAWNFPVYNVNRAASSALAAGCSVVIRPSEYTPRSAMLYGAALTEAGVPAGVINVVNGDPHAMGQTMLDDPRVRKIQFTGSSRVGRLLMDGASRTVTQLSLELGGNAPVIVLPDADIEAVARSGTVAKFRNGGQVCIAPQRFLVHESAEDRFVETVAESAQAEVVGHGLDDKTTIGPLINGTQRDRVDELVEASVAAGARVVTGAERPDRPGFFYQPTVLSNVPETAPSFTEELFGPVLPVRGFESIDEAIAIANSVDHGLAAFVWTSDLRAAMTISEQLEFGMVGINDWYPATPEAPFGGVKQSGIGRESGAEGLLEYCEAKTRYFGGLS